MLQIRKSVFISILVCCCLIFGAMGVAASNGIESVTAAINKNIKFLLDGSPWTPKDSQGNQMYAMVYKGSTYLPARAVAEALNAEVRWDGSTQTVVIKASDSQFGIPYQDAAPTPTPPATGTPQPEQPKAPVPQAPANNQHVTSSGIELPTDFSADILDNLFRDHAVTLIKAYSDALLTTNTSSFDSFVNSYVVDKTATGERFWLLGRDYSKENFSEYVSGTREANSAGNLYMDYANDIAKVTAKDLEISSDYKNEYTASITFRYQPDGWDAFSAVYIDFKLSSLFDSGTYVLENVRIH